MTFGRVVLSLNCSRMDSEIRHSPAVFGCIKRLKRRSIAPADGASVTNCGLAVGMALFGGTWLGTQGVALGWRGTGLGAGLSTGCCQASAVCCCAAVEPCCMRRTVCTGVPDGGGICSAAVGAETLWCKLLPASSTHADGAAAMDAGGLCSANCDTWLAACTGVPDGGGICSAVVDAETLGCNVWLASCSDAFGSAVLDAAGVSSAAAGPEAVGFCSEACGACRACSGKGYAACPSCLTCGGFCSVGMLAETSAGGGFCSAAAAGKLPSCNMLGPRCVESVGAAATDAGGLCSANCDAGVAWCTTCAGVCDGGGNCSAAVGAETLWCNVLLASCSDAFWSTVPDARGVSSAAAGAEAGCPGAAGCCCSTAVIFGFGGRVGGNAMFGMLGAPVTGCSVSMGCSGKSLPAAAVPREPRLCHNMTGGPVGGTCAS